MDLKNVLQVFGAVAIVLTLAPFIALDYWWIRIFDFPHVQLTILTALAFVLYFIKFDIKCFKDYLFATCILACLLFQISKIYPYTPVAPKEVLKTVQSNSTNNLRILTANVLQKNKKSDKLISLISEKNPDLIVLTETNKRWQNEVEEAVSDYKYRVEKPLPNTYGILMYSKLPLVDSQVKFMVDDSIPSIHTKIILRSNDTVQLYAIHPTPPMPQHNPTSTDRDAEIMKIAKLSNESLYPVITLGDFNDVAWSQTTTLFQAVSMLLDLRKGRGFFNTYNANNWFFRWPLDHLFVSEEFRVKEVMTAQDINSDHFPFYTTLTFEPDLSHDQLPAPPTEGQLKNAEEQIKGSNLTIN